MYNSIDVGVDSQKWVAKTAEYFKTDSIVWYENTYRVGGVGGTKLEYQHFILTFGHICPQFPEVIFRQHGVDYDTLNIALIGIHKKYQGQMKKLMGEAYKDGKITGFEYNRLYIENKQYERDMKEVCEGVETDYLKRAARLRLGV